MGFTDNALTLDVGTGETLTVTRNGASIFTDLPTIRGGTDIGAGLNLKFQAVVATTVAASSTNTTVDVQAVTYQLPIVAAVAARTATHTLASPAVFTTTAHGFITGTPVTLALNGGTLDANFVAGTTYYVVRLTANTYNLSTSVDNAMAATCINASAASTGSPTVTSYVQGEFALVTAMDGTALIESFTVAGHGMATGTPVRFQKGAATASGVTTNITYFVVRLTDDTFAVSTTLANATATTPVIVDQGALTDTNGVLTVYCPGTVIGSSGPMIVGTLVAGAEITFTANPRQIMGIATSLGLARPAGRALGCRFVTSAACTAGKFRVNLVGDVNGGRTFYPTAQVIR